MYLKTDSTGNARNEAGAVYRVGMPRASKSRLYGIYLGFIVVIVCFMLPRLQLHVLFHQVHSFDELLFDVGLLVELIQ